MASPPPWARMLPLLFECFPTVFRQFPDVLPAPQDELDPSRMLPGHGHGASNMSFTSNYSHASHGSRASYGGGGDDGLRIGATPGAEPR